MKALCKFPSSDAEPSCTRAHKLYGAFYTLSELLWRINLCDGYYGYPDDAQIALCAIIAPLRRLLTVLLSHLMKHSGLFVLRTPRIQPGPVLITNRRGRFYCATIIKNKVFFIVLLILLLNLNDI